MKLDYQLIKIFINHVLFIIIVQHTNVEVVRIRNKLNYLIMMIIAILAILVIQNLNLQVDLIREIKHLFQEILKIKIILLEEIAIFHQVLLTQEN